MKGAKERGRGAPGKIGLKLDVGGVLVSGEHFKIADKELLKYVENGDKAKFNELLSKALNGGKKEWNDFIKFKQEIRRKVAKRNPDKFKEVFEKVLGEDYIKAVRNAISYYREKTGKGVAIHTTMDEAVAKIFRDIFGADTVVKKFSDSEGIAIDDLEAGTFRNLEEYAKATGTGVRPERLILYYNFPAAMQVVKGRGHLRIRGIAVLDNFAKGGEIKTPTLAELIREIAKKEAGAKN